MLALTAPNPLLPASYDIIWSIVVVAVLALMLTALWQILRAKSLTGVDAIVWVLVVLAMPVLGAILWFAFGRAKHATTRSAA